MMKIGVSQDMYTQSASSSMSKKHALEKIYEDLWNEVLWILEKMPGVKVWNKSDIFASRPISSSTVLLFDN